ncbi:MAG: MTH938/NDUFAF3 family protein [Hyphomicrobiales bacterium]|nr:MTH938/NDUFAF3 family protein [Alphaproteobacteria bacterium]
MAVAGQNGPLDRRHLPEQVAVDGYGRGGFSFGGMSHRGSLLCLPSGLWAWPVTQADGIDETTLAQVFAEGDAIGLFLLGAGGGRWTLPDVLFDRFRALKINVEVTRTGTAVSTYNILLGEGRRVAAGLIAVD